MRKRTGPQSQTLGHESGLTLVLLVLMAMPIALDWLHRLFKEIAAFSLAPHSSWIVLEWLSLIHQGMGGSASTTSGGQEQVHIAGWGAKSVALVRQQPFHKPKFSIWNRHGAANAFSPQPFLVAPGFDCEHRTFQKKHVNPLVHEGAAESVRPTIGPALELGHSR